MVMSVVLVVGLIPSIIGRIDLRAFNDDNAILPFAFNCRRGRCSSLPTTYRRPSADLDHVHLDSVDDVAVGEESMKPSDGNDYDDQEEEDKTTELSPTFKDNSWILTFPYCSSLSIDECRSLLRRLERLRLWQLRRIIKRNVVFRGADGTVIRLLERRRRSAPGIDNEKTGEAPKSRAVRSSSGYPASEAASRLLDQYREWRKQNGYGRNNARWGRSKSSTDHEEDGTAHQYLSSDNDRLMTTSSDTKENVGVERRTRRSAVVVEIKPDDEIPKNERDMLDTYLAWRETHGYGTLAGRWG